MLPAVVAAADPYSLAACVSYQISSRVCVYADENGGSVHVHVRVCVSVCAIAEFEAWDELDLVGKEENPGEDLIENTAQCTPSSNVKLSVNAYPTPNPTTLTPTALFTAHRHPHTLTHNTAPV